MVAVKAPAGVASIAAAFGWGRDCGQRRRTVRRNSLTPHQPTRLAKRARSPFHCSGLRLCRSGRLPPTQGLIQTPAKTMPLATRSKPSSFTAPRQAKLLHAGSCIADPLSPKTVHSEEDRHVTLKAKFRENCVTVYTRGRQESSKPGSISAR
jgi:hypothetical protein